MLDIFTGDAFSTRELTDAINVVPNQYGRIGALGIFAPRALRSPQFQIESRNGILHLVQSSVRGGPIPGLRNGKRDLRDFSTRRFALESMITPDDVSGIRAFGETSVLTQVQDEINTRMIDLRANLDITREYLRAGAIQGQVKDADGSTIVNLFTAFGVSQHAEDFKLGTNNEDPAKHARNVKRHIEKNLKGDMMTGVLALCSEAFWDSLMGKDEFREAYDKYLAGPQPLRDDLRRGFEWQGIIWEEYAAFADVPQENGTYSSQVFIPAGEARFLPLGTMSTFRDYNAPADWMETVNTPGEPFYASIDVKKRMAILEAQMNTLPICMRPAVLVRGHTST